MEKNVDGLVQSLGHPKPQVRWAAMRALSELWSIPTLADLGHESPDVRAQAAEVLGQLSDPRVIGPLIASLRDPAIFYADVRYAYPVRISAIEALCRIGDPVVIGPLLEALRQRSWGYPAKGDEPLYVSLTGMGESILMPLIALLRDHDRYMRELAILALGHLGDPRAVEPLNEALESETDHLLKLGIMQALCKIEDWRVVPILIAALEREEDAAVRSDLVGFLSRIADKRITPALRNALQQADQFTQKAMIDQIERFGTSEALEALEAYRKHANS